MFSQINIAFPAANCIFIKLKSILVITSDSIHSFPTLNKYQQILILGKNTLLKMAQFLQFSSSLSLFHLNFKTPSRKCYHRIKHSPFPLKSFSTNADPCPPPIKFSSLTSLTPYLQSEWRPILFGWLCSSISVYSLSKIVPLAGKLSSRVANADLVSLRCEGMILSLLVLIRIVSNYLQQASLWEAALNSVYNIRIYVFNKVLERDSGFFESENGILPGDVAYRITAEAKDIADTVYSLLNVSAGYSFILHLKLENATHSPLLSLEQTIVPCTLQLSAMSTQMFIISPALSLISALVSK